MISPIRAVQVIASLAALGGCSTQVLDGDASLYIPSGAPAENEGSIQIASSVPASAGNLRIKVNGRAMAYPNGHGGIEYTEIFGGARQTLSIGQPVGVTTIELVDRQGVTQLPAQPLEVRLAAMTTLWVHDSPTGLVGEVLSFAVDADPTTVEFRVWNLGTNAVVASRCTGRILCPGCIVTSPIDPSSCTTLATVAGGERWSTKEAPTDVGAPPVDGAGCLDVVREGAPAGAVCGVQLDAGSSSFRQLTYLLVDGLQAFGADPGVLYLQSPF